MDITDLVKRKNGFVRQMEEEDEILDSLEAKLDAELDVSELRTLVVVINKTRRKFNDMKRAVQIIKELIEHLKGC